MECHNLAQGRAKLVAGDRVLVVQPGRVFMPPRGNVADRQSVVKPQTKQLDALDRSLAICCRGFGLDAGSFGEQRPRPGAIVGPRQ